MQVAVHLVPDFGGERRATARVHSNTMATVRQLKLPRETIHVVDISPEGCCFKTRWELTVGTRVWLCLPGLEAWPATIVWMEDGKGGMEFERPLHPLVAARFASKQ